MQPSRSNETRRIGVNSLATLSLFLTALCPSSSRSQSAVEPPELHVGALTGTIRLDGILDEPAWDASEAIANLTMIDPIEGARPSSVTSVRVLATERAIYVGVECDDPDPDGIVTFTKQRDGSLRAEDNVKIVLDTFLDGRSGYVFQVNPSGARYDALIDAGGNGENSNWDGVWDAATHRDARGWSAELWIPIRTLSFKDGLTSWHLNVERRVQRLQETDRWASPRRDWRLTQTSRAGLLTGLPAFALGRGLSIRPSVTAGGGVPAPDQSVDLTADASLDVTQSLGPNVLSSLSLNTDFAEAEVDTRRTNLTRFPLFFPEKRIFFLEGSDIFQFGPSLGSDVVPFFSRRIGLVSGQEVPILAGAKVNGRVGRFDGGAVLVRTRRADGLAPAATMAALRMKRNVWGESSIGAIATFGDPLGRAHSWLAGPDFLYETSRFHGTKNLQIGLWSLFMGRDGAPGDRSAMGVRVDYPNDLWRIFGTAMRIGDGFDPSLGFVPRPGVYSYRFVVTNTPRSSGWLRAMEHEVQFSLVTDLRSDWESYRVMIVPLNWQFASGDRVEINVDPTGEALSEPFEVASGISLPPGAYHWWRYRLEAGTARKRTLSTQVTWWLGGFYDGTLNQIQWTGAWHPLALVNVEFSGERDIGNLEEGHLDQSVVGTRVRLDVSPDLQVSSYWQYDSESRSIGGNTKLRWTFQPLGDLFVIYNHNLRRITDRWQLDSNQLLIKVQYAFRS